MEEPSKRWEILLEMDRLNGKAKEKDQGALASVLDLAKAFERISLPVVWAWAAGAFQFPKKDLASPVRVLGALAVSTVRRMRGGVASDHFGHLARVQVELLLLRIVLQDALVAEMAKKKR